jgi:prepilin peptidase CpaA
MSAQFGIALIVGTASILEDLCRRRVSNSIPVAAIVAGFVALSADRGWRGSLSSLEGAMAGFAAFLLFFWLGGLGGGDVKLMAGFGAVLGIERMPAAIFWTAAGGGLLAVTSVVFAAVRQKLARHTVERRVPLFIPYAPAIAIGAWLALIPTS